MKTIRLLLGTTLLLVLQINSTAQNCSLTCPENIVVKADSGKGGTYVSFPAATFSADCGTITYSPVSGSFFQVGSTSVIVNTSSGQRCSFTVTVTDNEPPSLSPVVLSSKRLWPANGRMRDVMVRYLTTDNANETSCAITITSNDSAENEQDFQVVDNHLVRLKASRLSNGRARIYMITVTCTDEAGNATKRSTGIAVAKNLSKNK